MLLIGHRNMKELISKIFNKELTEAESILKKELASIVEAKLGEKKKMITALDTGKAAEAKSLALKKRTGLIVQPKSGNVKRVLKSKIKSTDVQAVEEAVVQKDGLVHLASGEKILRSVYNARRWLSESNESSDQFYERHNDLSQKLKDEQSNPARRAIKAHLDKAKKYNDDPEKAEEHLRQAEKLHRMSHGKKLEEDSTSDIQGFIKGIADRAKAAIPEKSKEIDQMSGAAQEKTPEVMSKLQDVLSKAKDVVKLKEERLRNPGLEALAKAKEDDKHFGKQSTKTQNKLNALMRQGKSYAEAKKKIKLDEDCGLSSELEKKVEAAREMAKMLLQPQLDTTAPRVDRTKVSIPKGVRPADRLTAPDLGPKEDEWMHGKKLEEQQLVELSDELKAKYKEKAKGSLDLAKFTKKELFGPQTKIFDKKHKFNKQLANTIKKRKKGLKLASKLEEGNFPGAPDVKMPKTDASENPHAKKYRDLHNDLRNTNPKDKEKISKTIDDIQDLVDKHLPGSPVPSKKIWLSEEYLNEMARKVSDAATKAFLEKKTFKSKNTKSTGDELHLHGNKIAYHKDGEIHATLAGYPTMTTKERLNSLSSAVGGERFHTKGGKHYYGDREIKSDEHVILTKKKDG